MASATESSKYMIVQPAFTLDEKFAPLVQPDALVSAQYFQNLRRKTILEPEKRLMLAVLEDAVNCFHDNFLADSGRRKRLFEEAEKWIFEQGTDWIFSFENICEVLGFNPQYVRQGLLRWKEKRPPKHPAGNVWERGRIAG